jgi:hypothetical protein
MDDVHPLSAEGVLQPIVAVSLSAPDEIYRARGGDFRAIITFRISTC